MCKYWIVRHAPLFPFLSFLSEVKISWHVSRFPLIWVLRFSFSNWQTHQSSIMQLLRMMGFWLRFGGDLWKCPIMVRIEGAAFLLERFPTDCVSLVFDVLKVEILKPCLYKIPVSQKLTQPSWDICSNVRLARWLCSLWNYPAKCHWSVRKVWKILLTQRNPPFTFVLVTCEFSAIFFPLY